jgi:hypothetical protein
MKDMVDSGVRNLYRSPFTVRNWNPGDYNELVMLSGWGRQGMHTEFLCGNLSENNHTKLTWKTPNDTIKLETIGSRWK